MSGKPPSLSISVFPSVELADENGLLVVSEEIDERLLIDAYSNGIFPWPFSEQEKLIPWFAPPERALLFVSEFHIPKSLEKTLKKNIFEIRFSSDFDSVITNCRTIKRKDKYGASETGTWISEELIEAYKKLNKLGHCYSVESYREGQLVGGLYGVSIGKIFSGESMFHKEKDASKVCLVYLINHLKSKGIDWLDCQQLTALLESFGAREIPRKEFTQLLESAN